MFSLFASTLAFAFPSLTASALPLAQATDDMVNQQPQNPVVGAIGGLFALLVAVVVIASLWKVFTKAGQPGWAAIVPIYNFYVLCKVAGKPGWWLLLMFIPFVNFIILILVSLGLAQNFGKSAAFGVGLAFLNVIFLPILAFGDARYQRTANLPPALG